MIDVPHRTNSEQGSSAPATQVDVAREAGVSLPVVSYVLNKGPRPVAPATRQRVLEAMERLDYRPHAGARALRLRRDQVLGLVVSDITDPFYAALARDLELHARARGYALLSCNVDHDPTVERTHLDILLEHRVAGVFVGGSTLEPDAWRELAQRSVPLVFVNSGARPGFATVGHGGSTWMQALVTHLVQAHGHRRIAYIGPERTTYRRKSGYLAGLEAVGIALDPGWVVEIGDDLAAGRAALIHLFDDLPAARQPTAVVAFNDLLAIGALRGAAERGLRVPEDLAITGYAGTPWGEYSVPALTTVALDTRGHAAASLDALEAQLRSGRTLPEDSHTIVPARLVLRESCGCAATHGE